jgi:hypothetical protein
MMLKLQMTDGTLNRSISQKRTDRGKEISELINDPSLLSELLPVDITDSEKDLNVKEVYMYTSSVL